jgi:hypothetical protein
MMAEIWDMTSDISIPPSLPDSRTPWPRSSWHDAEGMDAIRPSVALLRSPGRRARLVISVS